MPETAVISPVTVDTPPGGSFLIGDLRPEQVFTPEDFDEDQDQIRRTTLRFMGEEVLPRVPELERKEPGLTRMLVAQAGELGLLGITVPDRFEGLEMDLRTQSLVCECLGSYASFSTTYGAHAGIGTLPIVFFGTHDQQSRYLPRLGSGEMVGAYCLSEPQAGSDSLASLTRAELTPDGKHYVLNGQKMWISNGAWADLYTVFAKVDGEKFSAFLVERAWDGVKPGAEEHKMGIRGSSTTALYLDNVRVPVENLLGEVGRGHVIAFNVLNLGRLELAAACIGGAKHLIAESASYALQRKAFGKTISEFGAIRQKLADMTARTFAGEALLYRTAGIIDARLEGFSWDAPDAQKTVLKAVEEYAAECSIAKVYLSEVMDFVADEAVQIHGGYGFHQDYTVERCYRDSRINRIFEGTNEINRLLTSGMLLKRASKGRLDLLPAIATAGREPEPVGSEIPFGRHQELVLRAKRATLFAMGAAYQKFGPDLERQQEVMAALSDMAGTVYASESAVLRAQRLAGDGRQGCTAEILAILTQEAMAQIREHALLVLGACSSGADLQRGYTVLDSLTSVLPANLPAARDRIATRVLEVNGYAF